MKKQILTLIIGILIGAIITTGVFLILKDNTKGPENRMDRGDMPAMNGDFPSGENGEQKRNKENRQNINETINNTNINSNSVDE